MKPRHVLPILVPALGLALALGCDKAANPVAPSGTILSATAVPSKISLLGEPSTLTVTGIRPDGNPIQSGTQLTLATTLGTLRPVGTNCNSTAVVTIVEADDRGQVGAILCGDGRGGEASISASLTNSGGGSGGSAGAAGGTGGSSAGTTSVTIKVQVGETDASKPTLVMSANPTIVATGATSTISFLGRASDGTPVGAGQRIRLTTDLGSLACTQSRCPGEGNGNVCSAVCTNSRGEAQAVFTAGTRSGEGRVSGILGTSAEVAVEIAINAALDSLDLTADPQNVDRVDDGDTVELTAILLDAQGSPLSGVLVRFESQRGTFDSTSRTTNSQGIAEVTLTVRETEVANIPQNGTFLVTATATAEGVTKEESRAITVLGTP